MKDINLLPEEERPISQVKPEKVKFEFKVNLKGKAIAIGIAIGIVAIGLLAAPKIYIKVQNIRLESLQKEMQSSKYAEINAVNAEFSSVSAALTLKQNTIDAIDKQTYSVNEIIQAIKNSLPAGVSLTNLSYDSATLSLDVKSPDINKIAEFLLNMNRLNYISVKTGDSLTFSKDNSTTISFTLGKEGGN